MELIYDGVDQDTGTIKMPQSNKAEAQAKVWEESQGTKTEPVEEPITREAVSGKPDDAEPDALPDRALVAGDLAAFMRSRAIEEENPVVVQAKRIEEALEKIQTPAPEPVAFEDQVIAKLGALEQRELEREQKAEQARIQSEYDAKMDSYREQIVSNIKSREKDFPALIALGREDYVVSEVLAAIEAEKELSEVDVASDIEKGLWEIFNKMKALDGKPSKDKPKLSATQKQTAPPVRPEDTFGLHANPGKKAQQEALWAEIMSRA